ncbi:MAG: hypothetical protein AAF556_08760, partial [Pseudomonadota bacterium]
MSMAMAVVAQTKIGQLAGQTGRLSDAEVDLLDRFAATHPDRTAALEAALENPWRGGPGPASWYKFHGEQRESDVTESGITGKREAELARTLAAWYV